MAIQFLNHISLNDNQLTNAKVHVTNSAPTGATGQLYFNSGQNELRYYDNSGWKTIATGSTSVDIDSFNAFSGVPHATDDEFLISDDGTEKRATMTMVANGAFALVTGDATIAAGGALTIGSGTVENAMLAGSIANAKLANSSITVSDGSNSTATALGGTITFTEGEGLNVSEDGGEITFAAELATATNKGVASFASADFGVTSGAVAIKSGGVSNTQLAGSIANSKLSNSAVTLTAGAGMASMGSVSLGSSVTVAVDGVLEDLDTLGAAGSDGQVIVATGAGAFQYESGATLRSTIDVDVAGTDNSTNVTLAGSYDYLTLSGQEITLGQINLATDVTGTLPSANLDDDTMHLSVAQTITGEKTIDGSDKFYFRDSAIYLQSSTDGQLDIKADTEVQIAAGTIDINGAVDISGNTTIGGNLTVNGGTTTVNSTVTTLDDPIITLGGDTAPSSADAKDRGVEFRYYSESASAAKIGFFGWDQNANVFTGFTAATNSSEAFSGTVMNATFGDIAGTLTTASQTNITGVGTITTGTWQATDVGVAHGGTGASNAAGARSNLGLVIGTNVQAYDAQLATLAGLTADQVGGLVDFATLEAPASDGQFVVATGSGAFAYESGSDARTSLGLGSLATANNINNSNWSGTDLAVANGGTGSSNASDARTALGLAIGSNVQAYDAQLADVAGLAVTDGGFIVGNGSNFVLETGSTARASIGLGNVTNESKSTMFSGAALTNNPTAPTQTAGNDSTRIATTAFVQAATVQDKKSVKIQGDGSTTSFTVDHSFNSAFVKTTVLDYGNNGTDTTASEMYAIVYPEVKRSDDDNVSVIFGSAPSSTQDYIVICEKMPGL